MAAIATKRKYVPMRKPKQPPIRGIEANRNYNAKQAALAANCSVFSIFRARDNGHLEFYTIGRIKLHSGKHLLEWLESGGKTGYGKPEEGDESESTTTNQ